MIGGSLDVLGSRGVLGNQTHHICPQAKILPLKDLPKKFCICSQPKFTSYVNPQQLLALLLELLKNSHTEDTSTGYSN